MSFWDQLAFPILQLYFWDMRREVLKATPMLVNPRLSRGFRSQNARLAEAVAVSTAFHSSGLDLKIELCHIIQASRGSASDIPNEYHAHPYLELTFVSEGNIHYRTRDELIDVRDGQVFLMPPRIEHRWDASDGVSRLFGFMVELQNSGQLRYLDKFEDSIRSTHSCLTPLPEIVRMQRVVLHEVSLRTCHAGMVAPMLQALVAMVVRQLLDAFAQGPSRAADASDPSWLFERARTYIEANLAQRPSVDEVAEFVGISRRQLHRLFATRGSRSPKDFITERCTERARALLNEGYSVKAVAYELGFDDPAYFSRFFKSNTGQNPSDAGLSE